MLSDFPILFNGRAIPWPETWTEKPETVETVAQTEAGTDQVLVIRTDKLSVSASFQCSSEWAGRFKSYSLQDQITVALYDVSTGAYKQRAMRIRGFSADLVRYSHKTPGTVGLYTIGFDLEEF